MKEVGNMDHHMSRDARKPRGFQPSLTQTACTVTEAG